MTNGYSSSSDEEGGGFSPNSPQHRFHIQLPQQQLDLHKVRKQNQKKDNAKITKATSNFAKATKLNPKKKGGKFADSYSPRDPRFSMHSSQRSSFDGTGTGAGAGAEAGTGAGAGAGSSEDSDSDDFTPGEGMSSDRQNQNLPHFQFNADEIRKNQLQNKNNNDNDDDEEEDDDDEGGEFQDQTHADFSNLNPPEHFYHTDSSDDENDDEEEGENEHENYENAKNKMETKSIDRTRSRSSRKSATSSSNSNSNSNSSLADVVPPLRKPSFNSRASIDTERSRGNSGNSSGGGIKGILRKMSLADRFPSEEHDISHSDTFLGRVFNIGNTGISGGGLAPGASRKSNESPEAMDEEKKVGFAEKENDRDAIEMKPIANFDDLSEEAKALIGQHLPPGVLHSNTTSAENSANVTPSMSPSQQHLLNEKDSNNRNRQGGRGDLDEQEGREDELDDAEKQRRSEERKKAENPFYAPNPDVFLRGHEDSHENFENGNDFLQDLDGDYIARPKQVQAGVLSSLLRLYQNPNEGKSTSSLTPTPSAGTGAESAYASSDEGSYYDHQNQKATSYFDITKLGSGVKSGFRKGMKKAESGVNMGYRGVQDAPNLPKNMYDRAANRLRKKENTNPEFDKPLPDDDSDASDGNEKYGDSAGGGGAGGNDNGGDGHLPSFQNARPKMPKKKTSEATGKMKKKLRNKQRAERLRITVHIADILQRQRFIMNMCRALMMFGAPTHRLEEYMIMTSRVLEIDGQFMYFPGCMLVSFGDAATRTSEVHLVRCAQGLNLGKLTDTHKIYKAVIHDLIGVEEASKKLDELLKLPNKFPPWLCVLFYGLGSLAVTPFAFEGGWIDLPISFGVGLCVGYLQFYVSSMSNLYSSVFEVSAAIVVAFIARGIGSIRSGNLFCFSAITQGSLALILPGYIILCGSLELQSRNLVAGSVRMFYAVIYSLFLGFGITLGAALYGWVDHNATSQNSCQAGHAMDDKFRILFVPMFALMLGLINQAKFRQLPIMIVIASTGYVGTYFAGKHFSKVTEFTACIGAFIVGILGNLYSRIWKGMAVSAMLPAIFVQVPSGIASKSTLISGLQQADTITNKNGTTTTTTSDSDTSSLSFGATMVEVSIGISVGLFAAALVVYPFGKKRTGLFTL